MKPGDRVTATHGWPSTKVQLHGGGYASFDLAAGDQGNIYCESPNASGVWIVLFDKNPIEMVLISDMWLQLVELKPAVEVAKVCVCPISTIMGQGCVCGHIKRYVPPHKRIIETKKEGVK